MQRGFAIIFLIASTVHHHALGYVFDIRIWTGDYLPMVGILSLLMLQLAIGMRKRCPALESILAVTPLLFLVYALCTRTIMATGSIGWDILGAAMIWVGLWFRRRDWPSLVTLMVPPAFRMWTWMRQGGAWAFVILSFALLVAGGWLSTLKGRGRFDPNKQPIESEDPDER